MLLLALFGVFIFGRFIAVDPDELFICYFYHKIIKMPQIMTTVHRKDNLFILLF